MVLLSVLCIDVESWVGVMLLVRISNVSMVRVIVKIMVYFVFGECFIVVVCGVWCELSRWMWYGCGVDRGVFWVFVGVDIGEVMWDGGRNFCGFFFIVVCLIIFGIVFLYYVVFMEKLLWVLLVCDGFWLWR